MPDPPLPLDDVVRHVTEQYVQPAQDSACITLSALTSTVTHLAVSMHNKNTMTGATIQILCTSVRVICVSVM